MEEWKDFISCKGIIHVVDKLMKWPHFTVTYIFCLKIFRWNKLHTDFDMWEILLFIR